MMNIQKEAKVLKREIDKARSEFDHLSKQLAKTGQRAGKELDRTIRKEKEVLEKQLEKAQKELDQYSRKLEDMVSDSTGKVREYFSPNGHKNVNVESDNAMRETFEKLMLVAVTLAAKKDRILNLLVRGYDKLKKEGRDDVLAMAQEKVYLLMEMVNDYVYGKYREVPWESILKIIAGIIYFVMLIDLIPDFIPVIGFADDVAILLWIFNGIQQDMEAYKKWKTSS